MNQSDKAFDQTRRRFPTTCWSVVLAAGGTDEETRSQALEELCRAYWYPVYAYVRWRGHGPHDAQDLTQDFFARLAGQDGLTDVAPSKGQFRSYIVACVSNLLHNDWKRTRASKRGGGELPLSLNLEGAEERYRLEPWNSGNPEVLFERRWALTIVENAMIRLQEDYAKSGRGKVFEALSGYVAGDKSGGRYREVGVAFGMTEAGVKKAVQRMRERYRKHLRNEIAQTVRAEEVDAELAHLFKALRS